jgi:hypothetical protein
VAGEWGLIAANGYLVDWALPWGVPLMQVINDLIGSVSEQDAEKTVETRSRRDGYHSRSDRCIPRVSLWLATRRLGPASVPVASATGPLKTPRFRVNVSYPYIIGIQVHDRFAQNEELCMRGLLRNLDETSSDCDSDAVAVDASWTGLQDGKMSHKGRARRWIGNWEKPTGCSTEWGAYVGSAHWVLWGEARCQLCSRSEHYAAGIPPVKRGPARARRS